MGLIFQDSGYLRDFWAQCDVPEGWVNDPDNWYVDFRAYDCANCECELEREYYERGYDFDCRVALVNDPMWGDGILFEQELARFPAAYKEDAEALLNKARTAIFEH